MPLTGITVLDLTRVMSGPYCTMMLGDLGARVIKIERPGRGDDTRGWGPPFIRGESAYYLSVNRNKQSLSLDFSASEGRGILERLLDRADVLVENFTPGTLEKHGLDAGRVTARRPRLVYCSISGYGQSGVRRVEPGYDAVIQAESGLMSLTGDPEGAPFRLGLPIADMVAGMYAAQAITAALFERERSGRGCVIDISLFDSVASLLTYQAVASLATGEIPCRYGNGHPSIVPYDVFPTADEPLMLAVGNDDQWRRFCAAAGVSDLAQDARFATNADRVRHRDVLVPMLQRTLRTRGRDAWLDVLRRAAVPCGGVRNVVDALDDPQLASRGMIATMTHSRVGEVKTTGSPMRLSARSDRGPYAAPPALGEHTEAILKDDLGLSADEVRSLREQRIV